MKRLAIFTVLFLLGLMLLVWGDSFRQYTIYNNQIYAWQDAEDNYTQADSAAFDGTGVDDMGISANVIYAGEADTVVVVEIIDTSAATADTIAWGLAAGTDTTGISLTDTVVIEIDSTAIITGQLYAIFGDSTGHTIGDRWIIQCYAEDADILYSVNENNDTLPILIDANIVYVYYRVHAAAASDSTDSIIFRLYNQPAPYRSWIQVWGDTTADADTISGAPGILYDSTSKEFGLSATAHYGKMWKVEWEVRGEEQDSNTYDLLTVIKGMDQ